MGARHFGVGAETTWGTAVTPTRFFEALSESVETQKEYDRIATLRSFSTQQLVELSSVVQGDVEILAGYHGIGILYKYLIGSVTTVTGSVNTHTFPATTGIPTADRVGLGLTMEFRRDGSLVWTYKGAKITGFQHSAGTDQAQRMTWSFLAASETTGSSPTTASYSTLAPMTPAQAAVLFDGTTLSARSWSISVENPVDQPFTLGSTVLAYEPDRSDVLKVSGSCEVYFADWTQYNKFVNATDVDITLKSAMTSYSVTYNLDKARIISGTPHNSGRERLAVTYEFETYFNTTATENVQIVLVNADATP